jgi:tetratricopeptide (TPR) repeat protein
MVHRPLLIAISACCVTGVVFAQAGSFVDNSRTPVPIPQADKPAKPEVTPEMRGDIFMVRKQYREAIEAFQTGSPKDPVLWNKMGIAYHQMAQLDKALKDYQKAVSLKKDYMEALNNIGTVYYARKSYSRAITYYRRAIKLVPQSVRLAPTYSNLGMAFFGRKQYKEAQDAMKVALSLDSNVFEASGSAGVMLEERSVTDRARFHYFQAKVYASDGRNELALQYLRKALEEGFKEKKEIEKDPDFATLRQTKEFKDLLALEPRVL